MEIIHAHRGDVYFDELRRQHDMHPPGSAIREAIEEYLEHRPPGDKEQ
jgi:hypothetical protein